jgi:hypothetical protein
MTPTVYPQRRAIKRLVNVCANVCFGFLLAPLFALASSQEAESILD